MAKGMSMEVNPANSIAAKHRMLESNRITDLDEKVFIKNGTHNCIMIPQIPNPAKKIPIWVGVIFKISTLKV